MQPPSPPSRPPPGAAGQDLSDAEFAELDGLLAQVPEPLEPLDVVMLDGFIAAVVVQPQLIEIDRWLPYAFDAGGHRWGEADPAAEQVRARALIVRRHAAINRALAEFGSFEPFILEPPSAAEEAADDDLAAPDSGATAVADDNDDAPAGAGAQVHPVSESLLPWVAGFEFAASIFPGLGDMENDAVAATLARLFRFLPADTEDDAQTVAVVDREAPLGSLDAAIADVVACVAELYDLTEPLRYQVDTVRRDSPKVGRNDPCPCGSGRKFKHCHGAA